MEEPIVSTISGIKANIQKLVKGEIARKNIFFIARDLEQSMLEKNYGEVVKTNNPEFQSLMKEMISDTASHRDQLTR